MLERKIYLLFLITILQNLYSVEFDDQFTLAEFGTAPNKNISLRTSSRYSSDPSGQMLRTNDFQTFQLKFGDYATQRLPCRMGLFLVSESAQSFKGVPFGTRLELSGFSLAGDPSNNIPPNNFLELVQNPNYILFNFTEKFEPSNITTDLDQSKSFMACHVTYEETGGKKGIMRSMHVHGSAFHDIEYQELTPRLTFGSGIVTEIAVDGKKETLPTSGRTHRLKPGTKFKFTLENSIGNPRHKQVWLIYAQSPIKKTDITFDARFQLTPNNKIKNLILTSRSGRFDGFLRVAAIQVDQPPSKSNFLRTQTAPQWQMATQVQSMPATPLSMFLLWPYQWTKDVGDQLTRNQENGVYLSSCSTNSLLIPLLARSNFAAATCWYNQLIDKLNKGQNVFDSATNPFVTLVNMLVAYYYDNDILNYQSGLSYPVISAPGASFSGGEKAAENLFDSYRSEIPLSMELEFNDNSSYKFKVPSVDLVSTKPEGKHKTPLFSLPGYKSVESGHVATTFSNKDPIKGDVVYARGNSGDNPGDNEIVFSVDEVPNWAGRFIPDDFWNRIKQSDRQNLQIQLNAFLKQALPGIQSEVYEQGKVLFQIAMSAKYAAYVLLAQDGHLPPYSENLKVSSKIKNKINPLLNYIKSVLDGWLITKVIGSEFLTNYFVGDESAKGIVAFAGTNQPKGGLTDSGNAVYTGHNRQYGYFLGSAALVIELDKLLKNKAWIGSIKTNGIVTGKTKQFVDMLWRDYANPDVDDSDMMPFNRYGNPWEGISCSKGVPPEGTFPSRNNESISEDFNGYYAVWLYARAIRNSSDSVFVSSEKMGFNLLERYGKSNIDMISKAAKALFYNNGNWVYKNEPFNFNETTGIEWDNKVDSATNLQIGNPPCSLTEEGCIYSKYKFNVFCDDLTEIFNKSCQCTKAGCGCN